MSASPAISEAQTEAALQGITLPGYICKVQQKLKSRNHALGETDHDGIPLACDISSMPTTSSFKTKSSVDVCMAGMPVGD